MWLPVRAMSVAHCEGGDRDSHGLCPTPHSGSLNHGTGNHVHMMVEGSGGEPTVHSPLLYHLCTRALSWYAHCSYWHGPLDQQYDGSDSITSWARLATVTNQRSVDGHRG